MKKVKETSDRYQIKWQEFHIDHLQEIEEEEYKDEVIYIILRKYRYRKTRYEILYVGQARTQLIKDRIKKHHKLPNIKMYMWRKNGDLYIKVGKVVEFPGKRLTKKKIDTLEKVLISFLQPKFNDLNTSFTPESKIIIINEGKKTPLKKTISI